MARGGAHLKLAWVYVAQHSSSPGVQSGRPIWTTAQEIAVKFLADRLAVGGGGSGDRLFMLMMMAHEEERTGAFGQNRIAAMAESPP